MEAPRYCYRHPDRETGLSCSECGRPICYECMTPAPVGLRCPEHSGKPQGIQKVQRAVTGVGSRRLSILLATKFGIPVSTTHTITGAIVGVGATLRLSAVRWGTAGRIVWAWILTIPAAALMAALSYYALRATIAP